MEHPPQHNCEDGSPEFVDIEAYEELCCSCGKVAVEPYVSPCGHTYGGVIVRQLQAQMVSTFLCCGKDYEEVKCCASIATASLKPDRAQQRSIMKKFVRCINADSGCQYTMMLRQHQSHLAEECEFADAKCPKCTKSLRRVDIPNHLETCEHRKCEFFSLGCTYVSSPEGATAASASAVDHDKNADGLHLGLTYEHLSTRLAEVRCSEDSLNSAVAARTEELINQEGALHMLNNPEETRREAAAIAALKGKCTKMRETTAEAEIYFQRLVNVEFPMKVVAPSTTMALRSQYLEAKEEKTSKNMKKLMKDTLEAPLFLRREAVIFKVSNFTKKRLEAMADDEKDQGIRGPSFYTHEHGYTVFPRLYANGYAQGYQTHLSVYIETQTGTYDSLLKWPLYGAFLVTLLSQRAGGSKSIKEMFYFEHPNTHVDRQGGRGLPLFVNLKVLQQPSDYLVDDTLFIRIRASVY